MVDVRVGLGVQSGLEEPTWQAPGSLTQGFVQAGHCVGEGLVTCGGPGFLTQSQVQLPWVV